MSLPFRAGRLAAGVLLAGLLLGGQAFAHAKLTGSTPAAGAAVTSPAEVALTFNETLNLAFSGVALVGPEGAVATGDAALSADGKGMVVPVAGALAPGDYTVEWHVLSVDGHKIKGRYSFTVSP